MKATKGINNFIDLCLTANDRKAMQSIFDLFFTPEELNDLALRFLIVKELLIMKKTQRTMAEDLNVSIAKITRGSNELKRMSPQFLEFLKENITS